MDIKELRQKSKEELTVLLAETRGELRQLKFLSAAGELKTVRKIRAARQTQARILTLLKK